MPAAAVQVPIGMEDEFKGVVDLVHWRAIYNQGYKGYMSDISPIRNIRSFRLC